MILICMFIQLTWGMIQNIVGAVLFLLHYSDPHDRYREAIVTTWQSDSSVSLGMFIFVTDKPYYNSNSKYLRTREEASKRLVVHEYGHTIQSMILGPLYLLVIGLPSILWCNVPSFEKKRKGQGISYYSFYTERWANYLGEKVTKCGSMRE